MGLSEMRRFLVVLLTIFCNEAIAHQWARVYDTGLFDFANSAQPTADGGYIVAGATNFFNTSGFGAWVMKLDSIGNIGWQNVYDSTGYAIANAVQQTADGGYIVAGYRSPFFAGGDAWILKLDPGGNVVWQKSYGGAGDDSANAIEPTADGGYIVAGYTESFGAGGRDAWVLKLDANGNIAWQKAYGGAGKDEANSLHKTPDGGYAIAGHTNRFGAGGRDAWLLKLDRNGDVIANALQLCFAAVLATPVAMLSKSALLMIVSLCRTVWRADRAPRRKSPLSIVSELVR